MTDIEELIQRMRGFGIDHEPDGWPAIRMRDISALCAAVEGAIPALDLLQARLEAGATIEKVGYRWYLFAADNSRITSGCSVRSMLMNLIFTDC